MTTSVVGEPRLDAWRHVSAMCDEFGMFEHAELAMPRREHGYCVDDVARLLIAIAREPHPDGELERLADMSLRFLVAAQGATGRSRNRRSADGRWHGRRGVEDCWGRSIWAFGSAARAAPREWMRSSARAHFDHAAGQRSPHRRAMVFAALGAAEVLAVDPHHLRARRLLADAVTAIGPLGADPAWRWPEPRLAYANAALAEVLIAAGHLLARPDVLADGLTLLRWLIDRQLIDGHLSVVPVDGAGPHDAAPAFDQQPIEVAALADACARAESVTSEAEWGRGLAAAIAWFAGDNDAGVPMSDPLTGGGFDGITPDGPNLNQGAESTLALLMTQQHSRQRPAATNASSSSASGIVATPAPTSAYPYGSTR